MRLAALATFLLLGGRAGADIVVLLDGRRLEGEVALEGDEYVVRGPSGTVVRVPRYEVRELRRAEPPRDVFERREKELVGSSKAGSADAWFELGRFAAEKGLEGEAGRCFEKAVELDPEHGGAHEALGRVRYLGRWVTLDEMRKAEGLVEVGGEWVTKEEAEEIRRREEERRAASEAREREREEEKPALVACPRCSGTGVEVWLRCPQCGKSKKPGYLNLGDRFMTCYRCSGKGKIPGVRCRYCGGRGKVDPTRPRTKDGRLVPKGHVACPRCGGEGALEWSRCPQCGRSRIRGFLNLGDRCLPCNRCNARGRIPITLCPECRGRGVVKEEKE
jgi:RecJ-like exonuclease